MLIMAQPISTAKFRHEVIEEDLSAIVQTLEYAEEFEKKDGTPGYSFNAQVFYSVTFKNVLIRKSKYYKISCFGSSIAPALKLKQNDRIVFTGEFQRTKGNVKWFEAFHVHDASWIKKVKELPALMAV